MYQWRFPQSNSNRQFVLDIYTSLVWKYKTQAFDTYVDSVAFDSLNVMLQD